MADDGQGTDLVDVSANTEEPIHISVEPTENMDGDRFPGGPYRIGRLDNQPSWGIYNNASDHSEWSILSDAIGIRLTPFELTREDMMGKQCHSLEQAETFYTIYLKAMGFSIRKGHKRTTTAGIVKNRTWLCAKEGKRDAKFLNLPERKKEPKYITREQCPVKFRVNRNKKSLKWIVGEFVTQHSHDLAIAQHARFIHSSRHVSSGALNTAKCMRSVGVRTCHILEFMANQVGGFDNIKFTSKDLYNKLGSEEDFIIDDKDAAKAIGYLEHKAESDHSFYGKYCVHPDGTLQHLFWADSNSRADYKYFGHCLSFDTTYRSNKYGKPLLVFVGVNHHFKTTIFALCILDNETTDAYIWALATFLDYNDGIQPSTVITDGDLAMKCALLEVMPASVHRLCSLHLEENATSNIKVPNFQAAFTRMMKNHFTQVEFEREWAKLVADFHLQSNAWISSLYTKRHSWAETFLRGNFFAGMKTTQRSEGMHAYLKSKIKSSTKLVAFVKMMEIALSWLRQKEAEDDHLSCQTRPVTNVTNMPEIEDFFANIYTRKMFFQVQNELQREGRYLVHGRDESMAFILFRLSKYRLDVIVRNVVYDKTSRSFVCNCYAFPTTGIPCRHILLYEIPAYGNSSTDIDL